MLDERVERIARTNSRQSVGSPRSAAHHSLPASPAARRPPPRSPGGYLCEIPGLNRRPQANVVSQSVISRLRLQDNVLRRHKSFHAATLSFAFAASAANVLTLQATGRIFSHSCVSRSPLPLPIQPSPTDTIIISSPDRQALIATPFTYSVIQLTCATHCEDRSHDEIYTNKFRSTFFFKFREPYTIVVVLGCMLSISMNFAID